MSIHVFFQAADPERWERQIFPYIRGEGPIDALTAEAKRFNEVRDLVYPTSSPVVSDSDVKTSGYPDWYDEDLTGMFRPFFIAPRDPAEVARTVEAYRRADRAGMVELVREQVRLIAPDRADAVKRRKSKEGSGPRDVADARGELDELRAGYAKLRSAVAAGESSEIDALELLGGAPYDRVLRFNECAEPYWLVNAWFTSWLFDEFKITGRKLLEPISVLFKPLFADLPEEVREALHEQDEEDVHCVRAKNVPTVRQRVEKAVSKVKIDLENDDYNEQRALLCFLEALTYAEQRGAAFAERIY